MATQTVLDETLINLVKMNEFTGFGTFNFGQEGDASLPVSNADASDSTTQYFGLPGTVESTITPQAFGNLKLNSPLQTSIDTPLALGSPSRSNTNKGGRPRDPIWS